VGDLRLLHMRWRVLLTTDYKQSDAGSICHWQSRSSSLSHGEECRTKNATLTTDELVPEQASVLFPEFVPLRYRAIAESRLS